MAGRKKTPVFAHLDPLAAAMLCSDLFRMVLLSFAQWYALYITKRTINSPDGSSRENWILITKRLHDSPRQCAVNGVNGLAIDSYIQRIWKTSWQQEDCNLHQVVQFVACSIRCRRHGIFWGREGLWPLHFRIMCHVTPTNSWQGPSPFNLHAATGGGWESWWASSWHFTQKT